MISLTEGTHYLISTRVTPYINHCITYYNPHTQRFNVKSDEPQLKAMNINNMTHHIVSMPSTQTSLTTDQNTFLLRFFY